MSAGDSREKIWRSRVQRMGFREAALGFLRDRLCREDEKKRAVGIIRRLSKYEPQLEILKLLLSNPAWKEELGRLVLELPEVSADPEVHFIFRGGGNVPRTPALAANRIYFGSGENLYALESETAEVRWRLQSPGTTWTPAHLWQEVLYVCTGGRLLALAAANGRELWRFEVDKELTAPYPYLDRVFVGSEQGSLYAVDARSGARLWTFNVVRAIAVAPGCHQDKIFAVSRDHSLYAVRMDDGECLWHYATGGQIYAVPHVTAGVIYLGSADQKIHALLASSGQLLWSFQTGGEIHTSPFEKDGKVFVCSRDRQLYALDAEEGRELWRYRLRGYASSPTASGGMVYLCAQGRLYGLSVTDGKLRWSFPLGHPVGTSPVAAPKRIYVGTLEGKLICLRLKTELDEQGATQVVKQFVETETEEEDGY